jgi:hypothetical protein
LLIKARSSQLAAQKRLVNESSFSFAKGITERRNKSTKIRQINVFFFVGKKKSDSQ